VASAKNSAVKVVGKAPFEEKAIEYGVRDKFDGFVISPKHLKKSAPGIVLVHNWMGVSDETKKQARRFAQLGYVVFLADIYGQGIRPKDPKEAGALATKYKTNRQLFRERLNDALTELKKQKNVNVEKLAVAGYCFGGTGAIELARSGAPVLGSISFHGGLDSPAPSDGKNIKGKILALHGAIDPYVPAAELTAFEDEMKNSQVDYQLIKYGGAVHSFTDMGAGTDITKGAAYNALSDERSFLAARQFLNEIFAQ
jgi:dienelactone hydrolase